MLRPHRPAADRVVPTSTYRLQIQPKFTFEQAAEQAAYLAALGVSHAYLSPVLQPSPGSTHGYDVVSHEFLNEEAGGAQGFDLLSAATRAHGLGLVVDVVPNHMTTPTPAWLNHPWWLLLRDGPQSDHAPWFDVDWDAEDGHVLLPVLGATLEAALAAGELAVADQGGRHGDETVLRYYDHQFPVRPGTESLELSELVAAQWYRLCDWREGGSRLNYRRFFDVTTLAAVRVEDDHVFDETHRLLLEEFRTGTIDGFRIDHPDGLASPAGYLSRLADATGDAWVVAEKILEGHEQLPEDWRCAGTTGYDTLLRVQQVFVDSRGEQPLTALADELLGMHQELAPMVQSAKDLVVREVQAPEVARLIRLLARIVPSEDTSSLRRALESLLTAMDRYRAYLVPGETADPVQLRVLAQAEARAAAALGAASLGAESLAEEDLDALAVVAQLVAGGVVVGAAQGSEEAQHELMVRFQQTCGPVMAKAVEDTAFYRYVRLSALNEVGGDPARFAIEPSELHAFAEGQLASWPTTMTTLSTHDTKRSEDVRARLGVLAEMPDEWRSWVLRAWQLGAAARGDALDAATEYLLWQTVVGAWPLSTRRLQEYATKAVREAKLHTSWLDPDEAYEAAVARWVSWVTTDPSIGAHVDEWVDRTASAARSVILGQKLLQLVLPGVPDVYQGAELVDLTLVDPDNRGVVDFVPRSERLARLDEADRPGDLDDEKLLVTSRTLRLRRAHPGWFTGPDATYAAVPTSSEHALGVARGDSDGVQVVAVMTRFAHRLAGEGGFGTSVVELPPGSWRDVLTDRVFAAGGEDQVLLADVLADLPVALFVRHGSLERDEHA